MPWANCSTGVRFVATGSGRIFHRRGSIMCGCRPLGLAVKAGWGGFCQAMTIAHNACEHPHSLRGLWRCAGSDPPNFFALPRIGVAVILI